MTEKIEPNSENDILHEDIDTSVWRDWYLFVQFLFYFSQGAAFAAILLIAPFLQDTLGYSQTDGDYRLRERSSDSGRPRRLRCQGF